MSFAVINLRYQIYIVDAEGNPYASTRTPPVVLPTKFPKYKVADQIPTNNL